MKDLTKYYLDKDVLFKQIEKVLPKDIGSRKKVDIFVATSITKEYYSIFIIDVKSRFLKKEAMDLINLNEKLVEYKEHNFKKKELLISSLICSKAKKFLEDNRWRVRVDFM